MSGGVEVEFDDTPKLDDRMIEQLQSQSAQTSAPDYEEDYDDQLDPEQASKLFKMCQKLKAEFEDLEDFIHFEDQETQMIDCLDMLDVLEYDGFFDEYDNIDWERFFEEA